MFKALFDSFFVVGAKEKPMPSFLAAYILTWLAIHHQVFPAFFNAESKGLYNRILMAINSVPAEKHHWVGAIFLTLLVVLIRFTLNNVIYTFRESSDKLFQVLLQWLKVKTYVSNNDHEALQQHYSIAQKNLFEARKSSEDANNEKENAIDKHSEYELRLKELEGKLKVKENAILEMSNANSEIKEHLEKSIEEKIVLKEKHQILASDNNDFNLSNKDLSSEIERLQDKVNSLEVQLSKRRSQSIKELDEIKNLTTKIKALEQEILTRNGVIDDLEENIKSLNREEETLRHTVRKLTNKNTNLLNKLARSTLEHNDIKQISTAQELIEKAGLADVDSTSRAKKITEDFKLAGLGDLNAISQAKKITDEVKLSGLGGLNAISQAKKITEDIKLAGLRDKNLAARITKITEDVNLAGLADANAISSEKDN